MIIGPYEYPRSLTKTASKHAAGRVGKKRAKRRNRRKP